MDATVIYNLFNFIEILGKFVTSSLRGSSWLTQG